MASGSASYISLFSFLAIVMVGMTLSVGAAAELVPDKNGVMVYDYDGSVGTVHNPKVVAQHGIINYDSSLQIGDPQARKNFLGAADWSYCDQEGNRARDNYHQGHIIQLGRLHEITSEPVLKQYSNKFAAYAKQGL